MLRYVRKHAGTVAVAFITAAATAAAPAVARTVADFAKRAGFAKKAGKAAKAKKANFATNAGRLDGLDSTAFSLGTHTHDLRYQSRYARTVIVGPVGTAAQNGSVLIGALNSITNASDLNRFLLKIEPGIYDLGALPLQMKPFVDIEGSGEMATRITGIGGIDEVEGSTLHGADNAELRSLTVENTGGAGLAFAIAVHNNAAELRMNHVTAVAVGNGANDAYGLFNSASSPVLIEASAAASGGATNVGVVNSAAGGSFTVTIDRSKVTGATNTILSESEFTTLIGVSQLSGGPVSGTGTKKCANAYDEDYTVLSSTCL
jgi:hypothetical protein